MGSSFGSRGEQARDDSRDPAPDRDRRVEQHEHLLRRQARGRSPAPRADTGASTAAALRRSDGDATTPDRVRPPRGKDQPLHRGRVGRFHSGLEPGRSSEADSAPVGEAHRHVDGGGRDEACPRPGAVRQALPPITARRERPEHNLVAASRNASRGSTRDRRQPSLRPPRSPDLSPGRAGTRRARPTASGSTRGVARSRTAPRSRTGSLPRRGPGSPRTRTRS